MDTIIVKDLEKDATYFLATLTVAEKKHLQKKQTCIHVHRLVESLQGANQGSSCFDASGDTCEVAQQEDCILFGAVRKMLCFAT